MFARPISWIKQNKLSSFLLLIVVFFLFKGTFNGLFGITPSKISRSSSYEMAQPNSAPGSISLKTASVTSDSYLPSQANYPPVTSTNRLVVQESNLSLLVKDVQGTGNKIIDYAVSTGGFMVSSSVSNPQEAASGSLVIRVPSAKLKETLVFLRGQAVKVVSEYLNGEDVTDQYTDINARLETLNKTKAKFEEIMGKATLVQDILEVQRQLIDVQTQIDSLKGQQQYLEKTAQLSKITIYLSTDELALPYAPNETWRPEVIFKTAVRSLVGALRGLGTLIIWIAVFSVLWLPVLGIIYLYRRRMRKTPI